jgi:hypothetical protein
LFTPRVAPLPLEDGDEETDDVVTGRDVEDVFSFVEAENDVVVL